MRRPHPAARVVSRAAGIGLLLAACLAAACAGRKPATSVPAPEPGRALYQRGVASWYGKKFHGRRTASGERYDMRERTAAHRSLPFGTFVRVVRVDSGVSVDVRINDRGPFVEGRVIDLSRAAAEEIDMIGEGLVQVELYLLN